MKRDSTIALIVVFVVFAVCWAAAGIRGPLSPPAPSPVSPESHAAGAAAPAKTIAKNDRVVMHINGEPITEREFKAFQQQAPEQMQAFYATPDGKKQLADQLVKLKSLEQEGRRRGYANDPEAAGRIDVAASSIIAAYTLQKLVPQASEADLRAEFDKQKGKLAQMELSHILIAYQGGQIPARDGQALPEADAMRKAQAVEQRLRAGGNFAELARNVSDDPNSANAGGNLGVVSPQSLPPELQGPVSALKENQTSQPIRSQFGIHIFHSGKHSTQSFEDVKAMFAAKVQRDQAEATLTKLQKSAKVELDPQFFPPASQQQQQQMPPMPRGRS